MSSPLTPWRIFRASIDTHTDGNTDDTEIDFSLGAKMGVELARVEFSVGALTLTANTAFAPLDFRNSLHRRVGTLETVRVGADEQRESSEIIADETWHMIVQSEAATRGGSAAGIQFGTKSLDYKSFLGETLILGGNLTWRLASIATGGWIVNLLDVDCRLWYRIVQLTDAELIGAFLTRRV